MFLLPGDEVLRVWETGDRRGNFWSTKSEEKARMPLSQWSFLDGLFIIIFLVSIVFAVMKGLAREIISLASLIGGFILAMFFYPIPAGMVKEFSKTDTIANLIGFIIIFFGCILIGAIAAFLFNRILKAVSLKWIDRLLGGIFGLLRGWAIASILVVALIAFPIRDDFLARSVLAPYLLTGAKIAVYCVPQKLKDQFNEQYAKVIKAWKQNRSQHESYRDSTTTRIEGTS
ncbi:MAG: CvpA family protein [Acidobacteriota bacterium]